MNNLTALEKEQMIEFKSLQRYQKEIVSYEKELTKETEKLNELNSKEEKDEYKIRNEQNILEDIEQVLPEVKTKFLQTFENNEALFEEINNQKDMDKESEFYEQISKIYFEANDLYTKLLN